MALLLSGCAAMTGVAVATVAGPGAGAAAAQGVQRQQGRNDARRAVRHASGELQRLIPRDARLWVHNRATGREQGVASGIADDLTSNMLQNGIHIVDRESASLIAREQQVQLSGNVRDSDILSIGQQIGATHLATVYITVAAGNVRRLQLRVLEIETGRLLLQSDTSNSWRVR